MQTLKTLFVAAVALFGAATAVNAKTAKNTDNNVSSSEVTTPTEHDVNVYGSNFTDGDKIEGKEQGLTSKHIGWLSFVLMLLQ